MDTLVSRSRGHIFFLDQIPSLNEEMKRRLEASIAGDSTFADASNNSNNNHHETSSEDRKAATTTTTTKKQTTTTTTTTAAKRQPTAVEAAMQKRYGAAFARAGCCLPFVSPEEEISQHIPDIDHIRSFLEFNVTDFRDT